MAAGGHKTGKLREGDENNHGERGNGNQGCQWRKETEEGEVGTEGKSRGERDVSTEEIHSDMGDCRKLKVLQWEQL